MRVLVLKDGNNTGDLPCILDTASDERQVKKTAKDGEMETAVFFNIRLVIPSIPAAELLSSFWMRERISEPEQEKVERVEVKLY